MRPAWAKQRPCFNKNLEHNCNLRMKSLIGEVKYFLKIFESVILLLLAVSIWEAPTKSHSNVLHISLEAHAGIIMSESLKTTSLAGHGDRDL